MTLNVNLSSQCIKQNKNIPKVSDTLSISEKVPRKLM